MRIRAAEEADAAAAAALWTEAYSGAGKGEGRVEPYSVAEFDRIAAAGMLLVAVDGRGALLGVGAMRPPGSPGLVVARAGEAELGNLAVSVWARGGGVGRALAGRCLELAAATGRRGWRSGAGRTRWRPTGSTNRSASAGCRGATSRTRTAVASSSRPAWRRTR